MPTGKDEARRGARVKSFSFSSLRVRLVILILIAVVPALAVMLYSAAEQERLDAALVQQNLSRLAVLHAREERQLLDGTRQILKALAQFVLMHRADRNACTVFFTNLLKEFDRYTDFGEVTLDGRLICTTAPTPAPLSEDDRR